MTLPLTLAILAAAAALLAGLLLVLGIRGKRLNDHPACRRCGFDLAGLDRAAADARCPECGRGCSTAGGRRAARTGVRRRRPLIAWLGVALILLVAAPAGTVSTLLYTGADLDHYKPVWLLLHEGGSARVSTAENARRELRRRLVLDLVSPAQARAIAREVLARQTMPDPAWHAQWGTLFEIAWLGGWLDKDMTDQYLANAIQFSVPAPGRAPDGSLHLELETSDRTGSILLIRTHLRLTIPEGTPLRPSLAGEFNARGQVGAGDYALAPIPPATARATFFENLNIPADATRQTTPPGGPVAAVRFTAVPTAAPLPGTLRLAPWPTRTIYAPAGDPTPPSQRVTAEGGIPPGTRLMLEVWTGPDSGPRVGQSSTLSSWWSQRRVPVMPSATWPAERRVIELEIGGEKR
jgi:hypothetical protein